VKTKFKAVLHFVLKAGQWAASKCGCFLINCCIFLFHHIFYFKI